MQTKPIRPRALRALSLALLLMSSSACVDTTKKTESPVKQAGDLMIDSEEGLGLVAKDVALKAILLPSPSSSDEPAAFVVFLDRRQPRMISIGDEIRLSGGKVATLRGLQRRMAIFDVDGRRETLTMPPLVPQRSETGS